MRLMPMLRTPRHLPASRRAAAAKTTAAAAEPAAIAGTAAARPGTAGPTAGPAAPSPRRHHVGEHGEDECNNSDNQRCGNRADEQPRQEADKTAGSDRAEQPAKYPPQNAAD